MPETKALTIGDLAARTGLSVSAIRFYEEKGLVEPFRSAGGQRRCGCLSLKKCALYNPEDRAGLRGPGPQLVLGD